MTNKPTWSYNFRIGGGNKWRDVSYSSKGWSEKYH